MVDIKGEHKERMLLGHSKGVSSISHGETEWLLSADRDGSILEWEEAALNRPATQGLRKHDEFKYREGFRELRQPQPLTAMDASTDGRLVVTGGEDGQIQLWDALERVLISDHFTGKQKKIRAVALAPDRSFFVTADASTILVWPGPDRWADIVCSKLVLNMSHEHWKEWVSRDIPYKKQCPGLLDEPANAPKRNE
jgi:WD40 repeat protein